MLYICDQLPTEDSAFPIHVGILGAAAHDVCILLSDFPVTDDNIWMELYLHRPYWSRSQSVPKSRWCTL